MVGSGTPKNTYFALDPTEYLDGDDKVIWTPNTYYPNQVAVQTGRSFLYLYWDGRILKRSQKTVTFPCKMNFAQYPFDSHSCDVTSSSYTQSADEVDLQYGIPFLDINELLDLGMLMTTFEVGEFIVSKATSTETSIYNSANYLDGELSFKRNPATFWTKVFIPDTMLHVALYTKFFIAPEAAPARVALCITSALSFRIMISSIYTELPPVSYRIWVVDFMSVSQALAVAALVQYAPVANLLRKQQGGG